MRLRDFFNLPDRRASHPSRAGDREHDDLSAQADRLVAAGDEAIARALSTDSELFLAGNRQEGGQ
ncbi:MAG: hypothetical protein ACT4QD_11485 [Acidobacteriota bacterium]